MIGLTFYSGMETAAMENAVLIMPHQVTNGAQRGEAVLNSAEGSPRPAEVPTANLNLRAPAGLVVVHALRTVLSRLGTHELAARHGDPEGVHRLRSASRRLRSELRALAEILDERWCERVEGELKWLASLLGEMRDLDILFCRLRDGAEELELKDVDRAVDVAPFRERRSAPCSGWATCC